MGRRILALGSNNPEVVWVGVDREEGDLCDPEVAEWIVETNRPDQVVHLAGLIGQPADDEGRARLFAVNAGATRNLLEALERKSRRDGSRPEFLLVSTGLVYGSQPGPWHEGRPALATDDYSRSKLEAEAHLDHVVAGGFVGGLVLRPAILYGPDQTGAMFVPSLAKALAEGASFPMTAGKQRRDFVHVDDFAAAVFAVLADARILAGANSGPLWIANVGTGEGVTLEHAATSAEGIARTLWNDPGSLSLGALPYRENESWDYRLDSSRLAIATGWSPAVALEDGIRQCLVAARTRHLASGVSP